MTKPEVPPLEWLQAHCSPEARIAAAIRTAGERALLRPEPIPSPPAMLLAILRDGVNKPIRELDEDTQPAASDYLRDVTAVEQRNASRLETLLGAIVTLRDHGGDDEVARAAAVDLARWTRDQYPRAWRLLKGAQISKAPQQRRRLATLATRDARNSERIPLKWRRGW